jgi:predicted small lipoprotein YifL
MKDKQYKRTDNLTHVVIICLLLTAYCLLLVASCGRRGDPVLVVPRDEKAVEKNKDEGIKDMDKQETSTKRKKRERRTIEVTVPGQPAGLIGIYTQTSIVLTWDEVAGQKIKYRVYRSSGDGYILAGETVTPAFTDKDVKPNMKYYYKVGAVGATEGPLSKEIQIITEVH